MAKDIGEALASTPWMGLHTFGEQGPTQVHGISTKSGSIRRPQLLRAKPDKGVETGKACVHGNLMFNCLLFGTVERQVDITEPDSSSNTGSYRPSVTL